MGQLWRGRRRRKERIGAKAEEVEAGEAEFGSEKKLWNETKRLLERRWGGEGRVEREDEELLRTRGRLKREGRGLGGQCDASGVRQSASCTRQTELP
jgi:hypothetical protein